MEQCTIYSHFLDFDQIETIVKTQLPKATVQRQDDDEQKTILVTYKPGILGKKQRLTISSRQRLNPSHKLDRVECPVSQNLAGMRNYVYRLDAQNEAIKSLLLQKIETINAEIPFLAQPFITEEFEGVLKEIIQQQDAFVFTPATGLFSKSEHQQFIDKDFNLILDTAGASTTESLDVTIESKYYDQPKAEIQQDQLDRKAKSEALLEQYQIKTNKNLPPLLSEANVTIREQAAVVERIYALAMTAIRGEGIPKEEVLPIFEAKGSIQLSPFEHHIVHADSLTEQEQAISTWRYESLYLMLWALGKVEELKYPNEICDVQAFVELLINPSRAEFESSCQLRPASEILDALDLTYRMNWACVDARIAKVAPSGGLQPGIVYERHYSLNWLTNYRHQAWDDVSTDT